MGRRVQCFLAGLMLLASLIACTTSPLPSAVSPTSVPPPSPTLQLPSGVELCAALDAAWGQDWPRTLELLEALQQAAQPCGPEPLASKQYAASFSYGAFLEEQGQLEKAIRAYQAAFALNPQRREALDALARLERLPAPTPATCDPSIARRPPLPSYHPATEAPYVTLHEGQLRVGDAPFRVRGVNYYPAQTPWARFLPETNPAGLERDMELLQQAGFNTLRVFLHYDALFVCEPEAAVPVPETFVTLDTLLQLAGERGLKVIVTLHDLPDLTYRPLYTDWARYDAQTRYIVARYRSEPAILAWDLRNEGDLDYGARDTTEARFSQEEVLGWLAHISALVRESDPHHLLTAGWWGDPLPTEPYVDLLSFHHWSDSAQLATRLNEYRARTNQPILLEEIGYHSWATAPTDARDEASQAVLLGEAVSLAEQPDIAGWVVWTAFDFTPAAGQPAIYEHFFGLWRSDRTAKPSLDALPLSGER